MGSREGPRERGLARAARIRGQLARDWRDLRLQAGLTQRGVGRAIGISNATYGRIERGEVRDVGLVRATLISAVLGADLSIRIFPGGPPLRDQAHGALLIRFQRRLPPRWRTMRESPMPIAGDQRAWDLRLEGPVSIGVEAETRPTDLQAMERAVHLKQRDSNVNRVILLVSDTERNRALLRAALPLLRPSFPLSTREVLQALREGRDPGADGLVVL
jgi:transcriptional regulator with XRE-family HTH domain